MSPCSVSERMTPSLGLVSENVTRNTVLFRREELLLKDVFHSELENVQVHYLA